MLLLFILVFVVKCQLHSVMSDITTSQRSGQGWPSGSN